MSEEFNIIDDDEQTMVIDDSEIEVDEEYAEEQEDGGYEEEYEEDVQGGGYRPSSNVYTIMIVLSFLMYSAALAIVLSEMKDYCQESQFLFGLMK